MDKQQLLSEVAKMANRGEVSRAEVLGVFNTQSESVDTSQDQAFSLSEIMYYIGGAIVFLGIAVLAGQNWEESSSPLRILITFGSALACFITAAILYNNDDFKKLSQAFFLISGLLAPLGLEVLGNELGWNLESNSVQLLIFLLLSLSYLGGFYFYKQTILLFFGIMFVSTVFHFLVNVVLGDNLRSYDEAKIWEYRALVLGLSYMLLGYYLSTTVEKALTGVLYAFGSIAFLGSAMALGGWSPEQNVFWELVYPLLVFGVIFLSVYVKSKSFLVFGSLFLIGYILKLTAEYFTSGLGWPLALVLAGLAIMAVGYYAVRINKKYLTKEVFN